jgi:hypothetical protein
MRALRLALFAGLIAAPQLALASDRAPVAVLWMGDLDSDVGEKIVDDVNGALARKKSVRPLDSIEDRRTLADGGPAAKATQQLREAETLLSHAKLADAAKALEAAETTLFGDVPFDAMLTRFSDLERLLLTTYDQLGRPTDAARAASRVRMAPGSIDDIKVLVDRHSAPPGVGAALPPVEIVTQPPGARVYRNLVPSGETPTSVAGGNRNTDFVDVQAPGFRRAHLPLGMGGRLEVALVVEDRLGVLVDRVRDQAPDAPAADVAALGTRIGAVRVLVLMPDGPRKLLARWLDVATAKWSDATLRVDNAGQVAMDRIASYCAPNEDSNPGAGAQLVVQQPVAPPPKRKLGIWGKWYTWVAAGGVVALVVGLLVAQNVGSDKVTVTSSH